MHLVSLLLDLLLTAISCRQVLGTKGDREAGGDMIIR